MDALLNLLGRFHIVVGHLPIGIFVLLALTEAMALLPRAPRLTRAQRTGVLVAGLVFALATALFGWLLARDGGYDTALLDRHRWLGLAFAAFALVLLLVHLFGWRRTYGVSLVVTVALLSAAGHFGGSLTHGEGYLTLASTTAKRAVIDPVKARAFADVVHPILEQRCVSCHGAAKSNGDLRYDTLAQLLRGGKTGPAFTAGEAKGSRMIQRAYLPIDSKEHMPPKGKPQLTDDELMLLEWWIDAGAPAEARVAELNPPPAIAAAVSTQLGIPPPPLPDRDKMLVAAAGLERQLGIIIRPLTATDPWLAVNARLQLLQFGDAQLRALAPIAAAVQWLDLGETAVTDAGLAELAPMRNLRRLHLDRTAVTDAGLARMSALGQLESLNLHATKVSDAGLVALRTLPRLRTLYLWQTGVTPAAAAKLGDQHTDQRKISRWKAEISALEGNIRAERFTANLGESVGSAAPAAPGKPAMTGPTTEPTADAALPVPRSPAVPVNTLCPVLGRPIDPAVTEETEGKVIAFCTELCREKFRAQPAKFTVATDKP